MALACVAGVGVRAEEPVLLADQADGVIDVTDIHRVEVLGIAGTLTLRAGQAGQLRFACRSLDNRREERPVSLWETESTMRLSFSEGLQPQRLLLEVTLPASVTSIVRADDSKLVINSLQGDLEVSGTNLSFGGRNLAGHVNLDVGGGSVTIVSGDGDVDVVGRDLQTKLSQIGGDVEVRQVGGRVELLELQGALSLDLERVDLTADLVAGAVSAQATGGSLSFHQIRSGGVFVLSEVPLRVEATAGAIEIDTDTGVEFENLAGTLSVRGYGAGLSGGGVNGDLVYDGSEAEVRLTQVLAGASISGDRLTVEVDGIKGDLTVNTTSSEIKVADAEGKVDLTNDFGDVRLAKVAQAVKIVSRDGSVEVTELEAPADVKADGPEVTVHWSGASREANSNVENASGDVRLLFSPKGGGRLDAEARGRIESSVPGITVADDGTRAEGIINRLSSPIIRVVSEGNLYLEDAPMVPPAGKVAPGSPVRPRPRN